MVMLDVASPCEIGELPSTYEAARYRAYKLLEGQLDLANRERLSSMGEIEVVGRRYRYIIGNGCQTAYYDLRSGRQRGWLCVQLALPMPSYDRMLAEWLLLRNDEDRYWRIANEFSTRHREWPHPYWFFLAALILFVMGVLAGFMRI